MLGFRRIKPEEEREGDLRCDHQIQDPETGCVLRLRAVPPQEAAEITSLNKLIAQKNSELVKKQDDMVAMASEMGRLRSALGAAHHALATHHGLVATDVQQEAFKLDPARSWRLDFERELAIIDACNPPVVPSPNIHNVKSQAQFQPLYSRPTEMVIIDDPEEAAPASLDPNKAEEAERRRRIGKALFATPEATFEKQLRKLNHFLENKGKAQPANWPQAGAVAIVYYREMEERIRALQEQLDNDEEVEALEESLNLAAMDNSHLTELLDARTLHLHDMRLVLCGEVQKIQSENQRLKSEKTMRGIHEIFSNAQKKGPSANGEQPAKSTQG